MSILLSAIDRAATFALNRCSFQQFKRMSSHKVHNFLDLEAAKQVFKARLPLIVRTGMVGMCGYLIYGIHTQRASISRLKNATKATQNVTEQTVEAIQKLKTGNPKTERPNSTHVNFERLLRTSK